MDLQMFFEQVEAHSELEGIGIDGEDKDRRPGVIVRHTKTGLTTRIPITVIETVDWDVIQEVVTGKREPQVLQHMTRVVGYFSRVENWNKSKVGELKDRQNGNYSIAG